MSEQRIYINSRLMRVQGGDDTQFIVDLGNRFTFKRAILNAFMMDNLLENFYDEWKDFSYEIRAGGVNTLYTVEIDQYVERSQFLTWFNALNVGVSPLRLTYDNALEFQYKLRYTATDGTTTWRPIGQGWNKIGFQVYQVSDPNASFNVTQSATRVWDFTQSPTILVRFDNLTNAFASKYGQMSYQVENNAPFGGKIMKVFQNVATNQQVVLSSEQTINQLFITLLNCDLKKLRTVGDNLNDIEVILNLSLFSE